MPGQALPATTDEHAVALKQRPVVVKLGGSVVRSAELPAWLDAIAASPLPIVIVPGGGALADEVRAAQARLGFGDGAAHRMALLAMDQLAWAVAGLRAGFEVGDTEEALRASLAHGRVAVWLLQSKEGLGGADVRANFEKLTEVFVAGQGRAQVALKA